MPLLLLSVCGAVSCTSTCKDEDASSLLQARASVHRAKTTDAKTVLKSVQDVANSLRRGSQATMDPDQVNAALGTANTALQAMLPMFAEQNDIAQREIEHGVAAVQACHTEHGGEVGSRLAAADFAAKEQCEESLSHVIEAEHDACEGQGEHPNCLCDEARTAITQQTTLCAAVTNTYEAVFCEHRFACISFHECHHQEMEVYNGLRADVEAAMVSRQEEYITYMQSQCLIDLITNAMLTSTPIDDASLAGCDDVSVDDLIITFPEPPSAPTQCPVQSDDPHCIVQAGMKCPQFHEDRLFQTQGITLAECSDECLATSGCQHFSHGACNAGDSYPCCMGCSTLANAQEWSSGNAYDARTPFHLALENMKCPHNHEDRLFRTYDISLTACHDECQATSGCQHFSYGTYDLQHRTESSGCMGCTTLANAEEWSVGDSYDMA